MCRKQISAIIVSGTNSTPIVSYDYLPFSILTRSKKKIDESNFSTPRLFVLWGNSVSMPYGRQLNDNGELTTRRRCYLTLLVDVDEDKGGYPLKSRLTSKVFAAIENNKDTLSLTIISEKPVCTDGTLCLNRMYSPLPLYCS